MSRTRLMTATAFVAMGLMLSGCAGTSPGVAVEVGDETISRSRIDDATANFCTALSDQFEAQGTTLPMSFVSQVVVRLLALRSQTEQIADEYGLEPGATYANDVAQRRSTAAEMPEDVRDDYVLLNTAESMATDILQQVGRVELAAQGVTEPTPDQASQAGLDVFTVWPDVNGVTVDPRYGLQNVDGFLTPVDSSLSVAVSDTANAGLRTEPDVTYANTLPVQHRCG